LAGKESHPNRRYSRVLKFGIASSYGFKLNKISQKFYYFLKFKELKSPENSGLNKVSINFISLTQ